jgi:uncharacterized protein YoxC
VFLSFSLSCLFINSSFLYLLALLASPFLQEYQQAHKAYLSAKDSLDSSQKKLLDITAESDNLLQDIATKEMAISDLTSQVEMLRQSVSEVEVVQREQRALFKQDCNKLIAEAM